MTQQERRNEFTSRLIAKYIRPGMTVLDIGCGNGEISFLLAAAVGASGHVDGIDLNREAITAAEARKKAEGKENLSFFARNINAANEIDTKYDAIFGRRVLMYQAEPRETLIRLKQCLKPEGIMVFQESDEAGNLLNGEQFPLHRMAQTWIWETVRREGGNTHIGSALYGLMKSAGLAVQENHAELVLQTEETGSDLAWVVRMMEQRMRKLGIPLETEHLEERLAEERRTTAAAFVRDLAFGICVTLS